MLNQMAALLQQRGYKPYSINGRTRSYVKEADDELFLIILNAYISDDNVSSDHYGYYERMIQSINFKVVTEYKKKVNTLLIIVNRDGIFDEKLTDVVSKISGIWLLAADTGKIYIYENQPGGFEGDLKEYLENNLFRLEKERKKEIPFKLTPVNISIVILNIAVFIAVMIINDNLLASYDADIMLKMGAMSYDTFVSGRWYEIISSMFLHFGIAHLFNNMLLLTYIGCELEKRIGGVKYLIVYMVSGLIGNAASLFYYSRIGETKVVCAGASGAIFGIMGCLAVYLLISPSKNENLTTRRLMLMAILTIYYGLTSVGIDNAAHIGGFCSGLVGGFLLSKILYYDKLGTVDFMR